MYAKHRKNIISYPFEDEKLVQYLISLGFSKYCASKYSTAIRIFTADPFLEKTGTIDAIRKYWLSGKDLKDPWNYGNYKFKTIGEMARAIENFIRMRVNLEGPFNPCLPL